MDDTCFLLPFDEEPKCSVAGPLEEDARSSPDLENLSHHISCFRVCMLYRTGTATMEVGAALTAFRLKAGQYVLLRPSDNSYRPSIGQVITFWTDKRRVVAQECHVRVKWCYRAEDLGEIPDIAIGEDEVFLSNHVDDCPVETIVGRCTVSPYVEWLISIKRDVSCRAPEKPEEPSSDAMSDTHSSFGDNYASSSVRYYYRKSFNPSLCEARQTDGDEFKLGSSDDDEDMQGLEKIDEFAPRKRSRALSQKRHRQRAAHLVLPHQISSTPRLQCRDSEQETIREFLANSLSGRTNNSSRCLYVSGVPGTGKTATVREVLSHFGNQHGEQQQFDVIEINAMGLADVNLLYSKVDQALTGVKNYSPQQCAQRLNKFFREGMEISTSIPKARQKSRKLVVVLDEMDVLVSKDQKVLYDVLDWSASTKMNFVVVCIANTMNLPERMLPRISSRLGVNRVVFSPYTTSQLKIILSGFVNSRSELQCDPSAIQLCAAKVGAVSGDVRRAFEILQRANDILHSGEAGRKVTADLINLAVEDISQGGKLRSIAETSDIEALFMTAIIKLRREKASTVDPITLEGIFGILMHNAGSVQCGLMLSTHELESVCDGLESRNLITVNRVHYFPHSHVSLNVRESDLCFALPQQTITALLGSVSG